MTYLAKLRAKGITVRLLGDDKLGVSPWSKISDRRKAWIAEHKAEIIAELRNPPKPAQPVGTRLKQIVERFIPKRFLARLDPLQCGCRDYEAKMNEWGIERSKRERKRIVKHLVRQSDQLGTPIAVVPKPVRRLVAGRLVDAAIRAEERKARRQ